MTDNKIKPVVMGLFVRRTEVGFMVMTQTRKVLTPGYDPHNHMTQECVGESFGGKPGVPLLTLLYDGIVEECGVDLREMPHLIVGNDEGEVWRETGRGDATSFLRPFAYVHSVAEPQLWTGPVFVLVVTEEFQPDYSKGNGEAIDCTWWHPAELLSEIQKKPLKFMTLHTPAIRYLCEQLIAKGAEALA